jgi:hypothetical protein
MKTRLALEEAREVQTKCLDTLAETYALQCESHELQCDLMEALRHLQELALRAGVTIIVATEAATTAAVLSNPGPAVHVSLIIPPMADPTQDSGADPGQLCRRTVAGTLGPGSE